MIFDPNPLFYEMVRIFKENYSPDNKVVICNEGSSRSSKTWDFFHFLVLYCDHNRGKGNEIYILRETLTNCKDFTLKEFKNCLKIMQIWDDEFFKSPQKPEYNLFGNHIYFRGLDDSSEGYPSDIVFVNEALENNNKEKVEGIDMRCRKLMVYDWNPKYTQHWCFDLQGGPNVFFTHSTYKNNKHLQGSVRRKIESYDPSIKENIINGTADDYRWKVYGLGLRAAPEGIIFQNVRYIDSFPNLAYNYGMDFGFTTDPNAIVKYAEDATDIYLELLCYQPIETPDAIDEYATKIGINKKLPVTADSSDKFTNERHGTIEMVVSLKKKGWNIFKVSKTYSVMFWLLRMKHKRINIVKNHLWSYARKEQENYRLKIINGIAINQPIDEFNHFWDASRYAFMAANTKKSLNAKKR
jgi:phage terminase large subunit